MGSKWQGKAWATLGDSITEANGYQPLVQEALGFAKVDNLGKSGCPLTAGGETDKGSTVNVGAGIGSYDCVTVFAGVNDFRLHKPLGTLESRNPYDFYGAYAALIEGILLRNPYCRLSLWTPLQRNKDGFDTERRNDQGCQLRDYVNAVRAIGAHYALPVLDVYEQSGINQLTLPAFTVDGLHPNEEGHRRIAGMAISFLESL